MLTVYEWMHQKRIDDAAEGLWRIHNKVTLAIHFFLALPHNVYVPQRRYTIYRASLRHILGAKNGSK
jgi:hypothetical protein